MDLEPTLEEVFQEYCLIPPDIFSDKRIVPRGRAFCECWKHRHDDHYFQGSRGDSISCGCALCRLYCTIYRLTRIGLPLWRMDRGEVKTRLFEYNLDALFDSVYHGFQRDVWNIANSRVHYLLIEFFQIEAYPSLRGLPVSEPLPESTDSDQSFRLAKKWLEDCLEKHSQLCCGSQKLPPLPKRVLDLDCSPDEIRLLEDSDETSPYICLSHCWGDATHHPLQTTSENISSHREGIPFAGLPKTFQEAATFVRRLGYRYLWIDSLCIIQNDDEDWRVQASGMADVYQGCLLTIAAAAAANSAQGLFSHLSPGPRGVLLSDLTEQEDDSNVWIRQKLEHEREPLSTRGWVLQERALSPRTLYFGKDELTWECLEAAACQCGQLCDTSSTLKSRIHSGSEDRPKSREAVFDGWYSVVEEYSNLQLSQEEDIFPAISGISKQFRTLLGSQYIAGLWRDKALSGLCWQLVSEPDRLFGPVQARRSSKWRAPSFSWANVVLSQGFHIIYWPKHVKLDHPCVKLMDAHCVPVGADDTGQLSDAYIDLEGTLVAATFNKNPVICWVDVHSDSYHPLDWHFYADYDYEIDGPHQIVVGDEVFCLLISEWEEIPNRRTSFWLVLRAVERRQDARNGCEGTTESIPVYERVGIVTQDLQGGNDFENLRPADLDGSKVVVRII